MGYRTGKTLSAGVATKIKVGLLVCACLLPLGCGLTGLAKRPSGHLSPSTPAFKDSSGAVAEVPPPIVDAPYLPAPKPQSNQETYTVVVNQVPVRELLFAMARDADLNIDILGDIDGEVTLNAVDQTLIQILERIALQAPLRYKLDEAYLLITADDPYLQTYPIGYLNMARTSASRVDLATQIQSTGFGAQDGGSSGSNNSQTQVENVSDNAFWNTLVGNIGDILSLDSSTSDELSTDRGAVIVNRETGYLTVRATRAQHREIQLYIDQVLASARRQVLIEATVVEITLSNSYQAGVDWSVLTNDPDGFDIIQNLTSARLTSAPAFAFAYKDPDASIGNVNGSLKSLEQFGDVQVLSSPKIIALNNQTAILKVVDNRVYFTTTVEITEGTANTAGRETFETEIHTVPVGFVMNVTPFVNGKDEVILNVRPTISRILGFVKDPNPALAQVGVESLIPEIQVREMESLLRVNSGQVAVMGGLMQDKVNKVKSAVPGLSKLPLIGKVFSFDEDEVVKTELLVFLRPMVVHNPSLNGDLKAFRDYLPTPSGIGSITPHSGS